MFPEMIRIGHIDYVIEQMGTSWMLDSNAYGECLPHKAIIRVCVEGVAECVALETLWHEVMHAINAVADVTDKTDEEQAVQRTSPVWLQVFRDNPTFLAMVNRYAEEKGKH